MLIDVYLTELSSSFDLVYPDSSIVDYSLINPIYENLTQFSLAFWMKTYDASNYGCVLSYANEEHQNALTLTD